MALADYVEEIEKQSLKCRKCRFLVVEQPPHKILSPTGLETDGDQESSNTFNICDENLPQWISAAVEEVMSDCVSCSLSSPVQAGWTKGKLSCPGCGARLGGFDYVTRASLPVYIVRSKVDLKLTGSNTQHDRRIVQPREADGGDSSETGSQSAGLCPA